MWPGPGLVVMALAFISVARRGISQQIIPNQGNKLGKVGDENTGSLARVNPWLSACDLAQPNSAPDLQGQCSAGTLPVALVNEGPGPPECPLSCETLRLIDRNTANNNNNKMEENRFNEKQQCLDYFGDNEESSPAQICKKSSRDIITTKLRSLRLRHCCERSAFSAIHNDALVDIYKGGSDCIRTLNDLLDADALASRITCELNEILVRYDCRQLYSIKHGCRDCKEAYRRWVCSTLIPYFAEPDDIRHNLTIVNKNGNTSSTKASSSSSSRSTRNVNDVKENVLTGLVDHEEDPVLSRLLKRSRRKSETIRKKIRPCLSVCQTVEENCPYMLPGDRAPAHPTQYAGEPTFLCLDPNIPETGDQLAKSNHGPDKCCYRYCGSVKDGLCAYCDLPTNQTASKRDEHIVEPEICQSQPGTPSTSPQRCITPFQAAAAAMLSLSSSSSSSFSSSSSSSSNRLLASSSNNQFFYYYYTWTISWSLISVTAWNRFCLQLAGS